MLPHGQNDTPTYLNLRRAAEYLDLTERSVRRYIATGQIKAYRLGPREIRIKTDDLDKLMRPIPTTTGSN